MRRKHRFVAAQHRTRGTVATPVVAGTGQGGAKLQALDQRLKQQESAHDPNAVSAVSR
jgi:hypothetical protein